MISLKDLSEFLSTSTLGSQRVAGWDNHQTLGKTVITNWQWMWRRSGDEYCIKVDDYGRVARDFGGSVGD